MDPGRSLTILQEDWAMVDFARRRAAKAIAVLAAAPLVAGCGERPRARLATFAGSTMAGDYTIKIADAGPMSAAAERALAQELFAAVDAVDRRMSTYRADSELSRLNRHAADAPFALSPELADVLGKAQSVSAASWGAFDVTVGPLVNAWGFGPDDRTAGHAVLPTAVDLARLRARVNWRSLAIDGHAGTLTKTRPDTYVDLSGIAQGYGADRIAAVLEARGLGDYMVNVSGEVRARGINADGAPWRIGIERPDGSAPALQYVVPLANRALATSGDYRNFFERDGRRYSHEIDPHTGAPVAHRLASVSVVHPDCALADAWATALFVLGPERGREVALAQNLPAYFISRAADGTFVESQTPAFAALGGRSAAAG
jgi:thiamine biosynthesis lipoprotein